MFDKLINKSAMKSPWIFHINAGSCNGCDIEIVAVMTTLYDAERFGFKIVGSPRHADIVVVSGPVTLQSRDRLIRTLAQVPEPKCVVSVGSCPQSGNVFKGSYALDGPLEKYVHVDVAVAGCAAKPEAIMEGLYKAAQILEEKRKKIRSAAGKKDSPDASGEPESENDAGCGAASDLPENISERDIVESSSVQNAAGGTESEGKEEVGV